MTVNDALTVVMYKQSHEDMTSGKRAENIKKNGGTPIKKGPGSDGEEDDDQPMPVELQWGDGDDPEQQQQQHHHVMKVESGEVSLQQQQGHQQQQQQNAGGAAQFFYLCQSAPGGSYATAAKIAHRTVISTRAKQPSWKPEPLRHGSVTESQRWPLHMSQLYTVPKAAGREAQLSHTRVRT